MGGVLVYANEARMVESDTTCTCTYFLQILAMTLLGWLQKIPRRIY
jgi:hypothetical protein